MEKLRIKIGKKKTVSAMVDEFAIGGTTDHDSLKNRDMNNQHPINAITGLEDALNDRVTNENLIAEVDSALKSAKESGLFDGKDGEDGHTPQKGIDYFDGEPGNDGVGILSIEQESASSTDGGENIIKITLTDGRVQRFIIKNGSGGEVEISQYDVIEALGYTPIDSANIVNNLETNIVNYPLSAAQGAKLKRLIDDITVPTKTSELTNDSKFMSTEEVVAKINEAIAGVAGGLKFDIVDTIEDLPTWCDDSNTIYLVPSEKTESNQYYNEYLWMNGRWEKLGDTRVNLAPYYTELEVDNLIYNVQKSIPTKVSQLYNDAGYITAGDLETGEATWDSIKGNIVYPIEEFIDWDGNTEGLDTWGAGASIAYRVSDRVLRSEEFSKSGMTVYYDSGGSLGVASALTATESDGKWYSTAYGVGCVFDSELAELPAGIYFSAYNFSELGMPRKLGPFIKEKLKKELLPDIMETVGSDTLTWDGNTEGKYTLDLSFMMGSETPVGSVVATKVSDATPTLEELNAGATIVMNLVDDLPNDALIAGGTIPNFVQYQNFENVYVSEKVVNGNSTSYNFVVAVVTSATDGGNGIVFEEGIYLVKMNLSLFLEGAKAFLFPTSVTFNGYTFKKEVIKEEYLPPMEGMVVKSKTFTENPYQWLWENTDKVLKAYINGSGDTMSPNVYKGDKGDGLSVFLESVTMTMTSDSLVYVLYTFQLKETVVLLSIATYTIAGGNVSYELEGQTEIPSEEFFSEGAFTVYYVD